MTAWCRLPDYCIFSSDIRLTFGQTPQLSCLLGSSHPNKRWFSWQGAAYCALWDERTVHVWKIILPNPLCVALPSFIAQGFLSLTGVGFLVFLLENVPFLRETYKMGNECFFFFFEIATHNFGLAIFLNWKQVYVPPILRNCVVSRPFRHAWYWLTLQNNNFVNFFCFGPTKLASASTFGCLFQSEFSLEISLMSLIKALLIDILKELIRFTV